MAGPIFRTAFVALLACGVAGALLYSVRAQPRRVAPSKLARAATPHLRAAPHAREPRSTEPDFETADLPGKGVPPTFRAAASTTATKSGLAALTQSEDLDLNDPALLLPLAHLALASVGVDDLAEQLWLRAINDPDLSPNDRSNLIEDLNEDGFPDPKNLTAEDLPLIEARLALINRISPDAMDDTNGAAFEEARKDLLEMRDKLRPAPAQPPR